MMLNGPDTTPLWERCDCACKHHYVPFCKDSTVTMSTSFLLPDFWYKGLRRLQKWTQRNLPRKEQADGSGEMAQWLRVPLLMQPGRRSLLDMGCSLESPPPQSCAQINVSLTEMDQVAQDLLVLLVT